MDEKLQPWGGKRKVDQLLTISMFITFDGIDQKHQIHSMDEKKITSVKEK
jgi:hypothetical protein